MTFDSFHLTSPSAQSSTPALSVVGGGLRKGASVGTYEQGLIAILDLDVGKELLDSWSWLLHGDSLALATTGFGDVFLWNDGAVRWLDVQQAKVEIIDPDPRWFLDDFLTNPEIIDKVLRSKLLKQLVTSKRALNYHEAFILRPWKLLGGVDIPPNYEIGACAVYVDLVGQTIPQLVDGAGGT